MSYDRVDDTTFLLEAASSTAPPSVLKTSQLIHIVYLPPRKMRTVALLSLFLAVVTAENAQPHEVRNSC